MLKRRLMPRMASLALLLTLVFVSCGTPPATTNALPTNATAPQITATPAPILTDLHTPDDIKAQFNRDADVPRLFLLVSPT
jgi:hypothetical protein